MKQYEIRWAYMPKPVGKRPVLLLSRTPAMRYLYKIIVAEITTTIRGIPQEVNVDAAEGLPRSCVINFDNVHVVAKERLGDRLGRLGNERAAEAKRALGYALGWEELMAL